VQHKDEHRIFLYKLLVCVGLQKQNLKSGWNSWWLSSHIFGNSDVYIYSYTR